MNLKMRVAIRGAVIVFSLSFFLGGVCAAETMTWEGCVFEAVQNHPDLISSAEKLKQAQADKLITQSAVLPQISSTLNGSRSRSGSTAKNATTGVSSSSISESYSYGLTGKQLLFDGFKASSDIAAASETIKASQYDYAVTSSNVRLDLRTAFVGLLRVQELIVITEDIASRRRQNLKLVKLRYQAGREHEGSLLTAEADLAQAEFEVTQAERGLALAQRQLMKELGREKFTSVKVAGDFTVDDADRKRPDFERLADNTPFLRELIAKKEAARLGVKSAKADFFPQVYLNGSLGQSSSTWPPDEEQWSAGVSLSFPLFEGGSRIAKVSKADSELNQARADERSGRDGVIFTLEETWTEFQNSLDKISVQRKYLEAFKKRAKIANAQYSTGLISFDDWIIIEDNLVDAKKSFLDSQANMLVAEANWVQARGGVLEYEN
jgi:outer membrane protein TolC